MSDDASTQQFSVRSSVESATSYRCTLTSPQGRELRVVGGGEAVAPVVEGDKLLAKNEFLVNNLWMIALAKSQALSGEELADKNKNEVVDNALEDARWVVDLIEAGSRERRDGYCSACSNMAEHGRVEGSMTWLCLTCGTPSAPCLAPRCTNFGVRTRGMLSGATPVFCAEHTHEIPDFEKLDMRIDDFEDYARLMEYRVRSVTTVAKLTGAGIAGLAIVATGGMMAAPAIGGAIGSTFLGLSGVAATNAGLAALGFGSLASGGLGMAGGTMVVTAAGALLGTGLGIQTLSSYISEDKSFNIQKFRGGEGTPVLIARGFTTESDRDWLKELAAVERAYPTSPIYLVEWGAKETKDLVMFLSPSAGTGIGVGAKYLIKKASRKMAKNAAGIGIAAGLAGLISNPWTVAVNRADKTALVLVGIIQRTNIDSVILVGHSLGGRIMLKVARALAGTPAGQQQVSVEAVHAFGAAADFKDGWDTLPNNTVKSIHNYYSANDKVLKLLYSAAMLGKKAVGFTGIPGDDPVVHNHDVGDKVSAHSDYFSNVEFEKGE